MIKSSVVSNSKPSAPVTKYPLVKEWMFDGVSAGGSLTPRKFVLIVSFNGLNKGVALVDENRPERVGRIENDWVDHTSENWVDFKGKIEIEIS